MIRLTAEVWQATLARLRACGGTRSECVVYWTGPISDGDVVNQVVHPHHLATRWSYEVDEAWLTAFGVQLHRQCRTVRVQVHTHCGEAFHSEADDAWPLVQTPGFLSLVLPAFARDELTLDSAFLAELDGTGRWRRVATSTRLMVM